MSEKGTSAGADSVVISVRVASDGGPQVIQRPFAVRLGFGSARGDSSFLSTGLIEPHANVLLPMFPQVHVGDHVVMLDHSEITII